MTSTRVRAMDAFAGRESSRVPRVIDEIRAAVAASGSVGVTSGELCPDACPHCGHRQEWHHNTVASALSKLVKMGAAEKVGERENRETGMKQSVYVIKNFSAGEVES